MASRVSVTSKQAFTDAEWERLLMGPPSAGMMVVMAQRGGMVRETISMGKAYADARRRHGESELLDEIVAHKPQIDHTRYRSPEEFAEHALTHLRDAVALLDAKATPQERADYGRFVVSLAERVAAAHTEDGHGEDAVSDAEQAAIDSIREAVG